MRLLNISTHEFKTFRDTERPPYAIASHRWGFEETNFRSFQQKQNVFSPGHTKVLGFCQLVRGLDSQTGSSKALDDLGLRRRCEWLWIDTACINKEDGAEVSESINSMFRWYRDSAVCYAYLADVKPSPKSRGSTLDLTRSQWFKRGWTLQELVAPRSVVFLTDNWEVLRHKCGHSEQVCSKACHGYGKRLNKLIAQITGIPMDVINMSRFEQRRPLDVEEIMAWARDRLTTRTEDQAYCLLGLLDVFMSPIYGEGDYAWTRLQQQLEFKKTADVTVSNSKTSKKFHVWFRRKAAKKETATSMVTVGATSHTAVSTTMSSITALPSQRYDYAWVPLAEFRAESATTLGGRGPGPPMSVPPPSALVYDVSPPRPPLSVPPPLTYQTYNYGLETTRILTASDPESESNTQISSETTTTQITIASDPALESHIQSSSDHRKSIRRKALPITRQPTDRNMSSTHKLPVTMTEQTLPSEKNPLQLKHRHGSAWSFHGLNGFEPICYHELSTESQLNEFPSNRAANTPVDGIQAYAKIFKAKALLDFSPSMPNELAFEKGDIITVHESFHQEWWKGSLRERTGIFPRAYIQTLGISDAADAPTRSSTLADSTNISTLAAGDEPGIADWVQMDSQSPGLWSDQQCKLVNKYIDSTASQEQTSVSDEKEHLSESYDTQSPLPPQTTDLRRKNAVVRRAGSLYSTNDNRSDSRHEERETSPHRHESPILNDKPIKAPSAPLHHASTKSVENATMEARHPALIYPPSPADTLLPDIEEQETDSDGFVESDNSVREDDANSVQSEHLETAHWAESLRGPRVNGQDPPCNEIGIVSPIVEGVQSSYKEKRNIVVNETMIAEHEATETITLPKLVLKALLDPRSSAVNDATQTALLANTAVEYIRTLLLSDASSIPAQQTIRTVEAYRSLETSTIERQQLAVAEIVESPIDAEHLDGLADSGKGAYVVRRQSTRESWFLHGVWADATKDLPKV